MSRSANNQPSGNTVKPNIIPNTYFGDVDGDGLQDIIQFSKNRIFSAKCNFERDGILHAYLSSNIKRLVIGDFTESSRERGRVQIIALMENGELRVYSSSNDRRKLWFWFAHGSFIRDEDEAIVGDFTGDGRDDILVYTPRTGSLVLYSLNDAVHRFERVNNFSLGNLEGKNLIGKHIFVGDFGQQSNRADLLVVDPRNGVISRYDSVTEGGEVKFWVAFSTSSGFLRHGEHVNVANISGGIRDGVVISGQSRLGFYDAEFESGGLRERTDLLIPPNSPISRITDPTPILRAVPWFGKFAAFESEEGNRRDDLLLYFHRGRSLIQLDARHDPDADKPTFWWAYSRGAPRIHEGWPNRRTSRWVVARGKLSNAPNTTPQPDSYFEELFTKAGQGKWGMYRYLHDLSYGTIELSVDIPNGWARIPKTEAEAGTVARRVLSRWCFDAHGIPDPTGYDGSISVYNADVPSKLEYGAHGSWINFHMNEWHQNLVAHEMIHALGQPHHSFDNAGNAYMDPYDILGSAPETDSRFSGDILGFGSISIPNSSGPGINAHNRQVLGWLPANRIKSVEKDFSAPLLVKLAELDRPECDGPMVIIIDLPNDEKLSIELRENKDWDQGFATTAVQIRKIANHPNSDSVKVTYLQGTGAGRLLLAGDSFSGFGVTVRILSINVDSGTADLEINR